MDSIHKTLHFGGCSVEDKLSALPEHILHHILSFLELKQAAQTSALARQWRHTWTGTPTLRIDQSQLEGNQPRKRRRLKKFMRTVDRIMSHDTKIATLELAVSTLCDKNAIDLWMLRAIRRKVREVKIAIKEERDGLPYGLPIALLFCEALRSLRLESLRVVALPPLPSLESLSLVYVDFGDPPSVFMSCACYPRLRELSMTFCEEVPLAMIKSPTLKRLEIKGAFGTGTLGILAPELEELCFRMWTGTRIWNFTPKLRVLKWMESGFMEGDDGPVNRTNVVLLFRKVPAAGNGHVGQVAAADR